MNSFFKMKLILFSFKPSTIKNFKIWELTYKLQMNSDMNLFLKQILILFLTKHKNFNSFFWWNPGPLQWNQWNPKWPQFQIRLTSSKILLDEVSRWEQLIDHLNDHSCNSKLPINEISNLSTNIGTWIEFNCPITTSMCLPTLFISPRFSH